MRRMYSRMEVEAILGRALELTGGSSNDSNQEPPTSYEELEAVAKEAGVPSDVLERAAKEVLVAHETAAELREIRTRAWRGFAAHLIPYVMINMLLAFVNLLSGGPPWMLVIALGWGVGLAAHLMRVAYPRPDRIERQLERNRARKQRKEAARRIARSARKLESAAERTLAGWLETVSERVQRGSEQVPQQTGRFRIEKRVPPEQRTEAAEQETEGTRGAESDRSRRSG